MDNCESRKIERKITIKTHLSASVSHTDIATRVTLLSKLTGEEFVEFSAEYTVSHELSLFADLGRHFGANADNK